MPISNQTSGWQKYSAIIIAIALLLIVTLAIAALAYRNTGQVAESAERINVASRLVTSAQDLKTSVYNIDLYAKELMLSIRNKQNAIVSHEMQQPFLQNILNELEVLNGAAKNFSQILMIFQNGGSLQIDNGSEVELVALNSPHNKQLINEIEKIWLPYQRLISNFNRSLRHGEINTNAINYATDYARIFNDRMSALAARITDNLSDEAREQRDRSHLFLIGGFILLALISIYLLLIGFRRLVNADHALARSQQELEDIMDTITEGLFLLDENYNIGEQHSTELEYILQTDNIAHRNFSDLLRSCISPKNIELTEVFLGQLFNDLVYEDLIKSLNPLDRIHIMVDDGRHPGVKQNRYLSFNFHRVYEGNVIKRILVSVRDISDSVLLEQRLEQERVESEAKLEMLSSILQIDTELMNDFLHHVDSGARHVNLLLKQSENSYAIKENMNEIKRVIHGLKGEASSLNLDSYTNQLEKIEDDIVKVSSKTNTNGQDYLSLTVHLDELLTTNDKARHLFEKLVAGKLSSEDLDAPSGGICHYLTRFAEQIGERHSKAVNVDCHGFDNNKLSQKQNSELREISLQLMRNAIVHGIELPDIRQKVGKPNAGHIEIRLSKGEDNYWRYSFMDDGNGIDYDKLATLACKDPRFSGRDPEEITRPELLRFMFESGTSTADNTGEDAGRGVGMDIIRETVKALDGKLQVHSETGRFTRFTIRFPEQE